MHVRFTASMKKSFAIEDLIRRNAEKTFTNEYNCRLRRLLPWSDAVETKRPLTEMGAMIVCLDGGTEVDRHLHDEEEIFIVTRGTATLEIEDQRTQIGTGDVVYVPRNWSHQLINSDATEFEFVDIYWDFGSGDGQVDQDAKLAEAV